MKLTTKINLHKITAYFIEFVPIIKTKAIYVDDISNNKNYATNKNKMTNKR